MCIYRRVHDEWGKVKPVDDCGESLDRILANLTSAELDEYYRQAEEIMLTILPKCDGDIHDAVDEFERLHPNAA